MKLKFIQAFVLILVIAFLSCKKKQNTTLGTDVQPEIDELNVEISDTATIQAHTIIHQQARSFQDQFKYLGSNQDPVFGRTNASVYTNLSLPNNVSNISFGEDAVLDSAEIVIAFTQNFIGDSTNAMYYQVHQLTQSMSKDSSYYMDQNLTYNTLPLGSSWRRISKTGSYYSIKIPIDAAFASALITNPQYLVNNTIFQSVYKGFYITTKNTNNLNPVSKPGALLKIDLDNGISGLFVYYHNGSSSASKEPKQYRFPFSGSNSSRFNNIEYNYSSGANSQLVQQIADKDSLKGKQNLFLKGVGGTKVVYRLPYIKNYVDSCPIAVNRAEVVFKVDQSFVSSIGTYEPPSYISLVAVDASGKEIYVKDQYYTADLTRYGGAYNPVTKEYVFNIARHVQDIMSGKLENYGFYLVVANTSLLQVARRDNKGERVVLGGINSAYKPTFKLHFVRLPYDK